MRARVKFSKNGRMKYIGHLDIMRFFQKALKRADIPVAYSNGFHPHIIMSFALPLGVGMGSEGEYFDVDLVSEISSQKALESLNANMPEGISVKSFMDVPTEKKYKCMTQVKAADYLISTQVDDYIQKAFVDFMLQKNIFATKVTKTKESQVNIKDSIYGFDFCEKGIIVRAGAGSTDNLKPQLIMDAFCKYTKNKYNRPYEYTRLDLLTKNEDGDFESLEFTGRYIG